LDFLINGLLDLLWILALRDHHLEGSCTLLTICLLVGIEAEVWQLCRLELLLQVTAGFLDVFNYEETKVHELSILSREMLEYFHVFYLVFLSDIDEGGILTRENTLFNILGKSENSVANVSITEFRGLSLALDHVFLLLAALWQGVRVDEVSHLFKLHFRLHHLGGAVGALHDESWPVLHAHLFSKLNADD